MRVRAEKFILAAFLAFPFAATAAPSKATNPPVQMNIKAVFTVPNNPAEGRDPFYPNATSLYKTASTGARPVAPSFDELRVTAILGSSFVQINKSMTLAVGETEDVKLSGGSVTVRLVQIKAQDETVVVEVNGQRKELHVADEGLTHRP